MGTSVFLAGMAVMAGWFFDIPILKSIHPAWVTMKFSTALSFCLSGAILLSLGRSLDRESSMAHICLPAATLSLLLLMATLLFSSLLGVTTGIEDLFVKESEGAVQTTVPGRPSVGTMMNFILMALSGLLSMFRPQNLKMGLRKIGWAVSGIGGLAVLGYLFNQPILYYTMGGWSTAMALHTALLFVMLGIGLIWIRKKEHTEPKFLSIRIKFITVFLTISLIPLAFVTSMTFLKGEKSLEQKTLDSLTAIAEFKEGEVFLFLKKLETRIKDFASDGLLVNALRNTTQPGKEKIFSLEDINALLQRKKLSDENLLILDLLDMNGKVAASSDIQRIGLDYSKENYFKKGQEEICIKNAHMEIGEILEIDMSAPVKALSASSQTIGVLVAHYNASMLKKLLSGEMVLELGALSQIRGLGKTGETYLVNQDGIMITDSLFIKDAAFNQKVDTWPVKKCMQENKEVRGNWLDYRKKPVMGASMCMSIGNFKWILISEQDKSEALRDVSNLRDVSLFIGLASFLFVFLVALATAKLISDPIRTLQKGTKAIGEGNLDYRVATETPDEIGQLSRAFEQMVEKLKTTLGRLGSVMEVTPIGIKISSSDPNGEVYSVNSTLLKIYGYNSKEEFLSFPPSAHYANPQDREKLIHLTRKGGARNFEVLLKRKNGTLFYASINSALTTTKEGEKQIISTVEDITERKNAEGKLRKLSRAVEQSPITVVITDTNGNIEYVNPKFSQITGYSYEEAIGQNPRILRSGQTPPEEYKRLWDTITSGGEWVGEFDNKKKNGEIYVESASITPISDLNGNITHFLAVKEDITDRKKAEEKLATFAEELEWNNLLLAKAKEEAEEATNLKDRFLSLLAHDLKNPLSSIIGFLELIYEDEAHPVPASQKQMFEILINSAKNMNRMIEETLESSRLRSGQIELNPVFIDIHSLCQSVLDQLLHLAGEKGVELCNEVPKGSRIYADLTLFPRVIQNLVSNAVKFCRKGGSVKIFVPQEVKSTIAIKDTGVGISEENLPDLFKSDVKTSTHGTAGEKGTGLGLPFAYDIMQAHGGQLTVESEVGEGSVFYAEFPNVAPRILVVDDEREVCILFKKILQGLNIDVLEAKNGEEALSILATDEVHLIISDIRMPVMDGFELLRRVKDDPKTDSIPFFMFTGKEKETKEKAFQMGAFDFITKPLDPQTLVKKIRKIVK